MAKISEIIDLQTKGLKEFIGIRVKNARKSLKMTQKTLANEAKVSLTTINRLEKGKQLSHEDNLAAIFSVLNLDGVIDEFINETTNKKKQKTRDESISELISLIPTLNDNELRAVLNFAVDVSLFVSTRAKSKVI